MPSNWRQVNRARWLATLCAASCLPQENVRAEQKAAAPPQYDGYRLVWSDEFQVAGRPDPNKWNFEQGFVRNEELQWYQPENAFCDGGLLVIEARRERVLNPRHEASSRQWQEQREFAEYTSASLLTRGLASWQYGRFEMRGRIDVGAGLWPAFWTLGVNHRWPACGEIDVMEFYRGSLLANAAWSAGRFRVMWDASRTSIDDLGGQAWARQFHLWRMDWDQDRIELSVDGRVLNSVDLSQTLNATDDDRRLGRRERRRLRRNNRAGEVQGVNPFRQPHYLLLNLAVGGTNGGDPAETEFPARFEVDYVRVYQRR